MASRSSPITSDSTRASVSAGNSARARSPPFIAERCFRTALISWMVAPHASKRRVTAALSSSVKPSAGLLSKALPPPDMSTHTSVWLPRFSHSRTCEASASISLPASMERWSGTGCPASIIWMERSVKSVRVSGSNARGWPPSGAFVITSPCETRSPRSAARLAAIGIDALPKAASTIRSYLSRSYSRTA